MTLLMLMTVLPQPSLAAAPEAHTSEQTVARGFTGTWLLDRSASDDLGPLLKAQGVSWIKRQMAAKTSMTQVITDHGTRLVVRVENASGTRESELALDGVAREQTGERGTRLVASERQQDGAVVTTVRDPETGSVTMVRRVLDAGVIRQTVSIGEVSATLVFRRAS